MSRILLLFLLFALAAHAQGVEGWITQALDPRLGPSERLKLLDQIIQEGGVDRLATLGLEEKDENDEERDPEVIHAVVDKLFATGNANNYIERIARLLLTKNAALREKIARRIEFAAETPKVARELFKSLDKIANAEVTHRAHKDPLARIAAIRALRQIPQRYAVRSIVNAWMRDEDAKVQDECKRALADVIVPQAAESANAYLVKETHLTYRDLRDAVIKAQRDRITELGKFQMAALKHADAIRCFEVLAIGMLEGRKIAAERLTVLVKAGKLGMKAQEFVDRTLAAFVRERDRDPAVAGGVIRVLREFAQGDDKAALHGKEARESLFHALRPLTQKGPKWSAASIAAVDLLGSLGVPAAIPLVDFARDSERNPDVRKAAVNRLGSLARLPTKERDFMGRNLAGLLENEKAPDVRRQILFNLKSAPVKDALAPIKALLAGGTLSTSEVEYCIEILRQLGADEAFAELLKLANKPTKEGLRLYAIRDGLLLRKANEEEIPKILQALEAMAVAEDERDALKKGVIEALGLRGGPTVYDVLQRLRKTEAIAAHVAGATKVLAERHASDGKTVEVAMRAVRDRALKDDELEPLIRVIIATCEAANRGAADVRYHRAVLFADRNKGSKDAKVISNLARLLKETVKRAETDGLEAHFHADACERYKQLLLAGEATPEGHRDAIECLIKLAELAGEEKAKAAGHFLEATGIAVKLKDRATAEMLYNKAKESGAEATALAKLDEQIKTLPSAG